MHFHHIKVRKMNLFNSWYKLLRDVGSNSVVFKLQLGVMLRLKRLKDSYNFAVLPRATALLLMSEVKPAENGTNTHIMEQSDTADPSVYQGPLCLSIFELFYW